MSEDDLRARVDGLERRFDRTDDKLDKMEGKIDALRRELSENSKNSHAKIYGEIDDLKRESAERKYVYKALNDHIKNDTPFESAWNRKLVQVLIFVVASGAGCMISILIAKLIK